LRREHSEGIEEVGPSTLVEGMVLASGQVALTGITDIHAVIGGFF
jgi:hypothetical protein